MTVRLTAAQATIAFLKNQFVERDGKKHQFFGGCLGIFGHGNVAGIGQALEQDPALRYYLFRNEQAMVHAAVGFAKASFRMRDVDLHKLDRSRRHKYGDGRSAGDHKPAAGPFVARRHFRAPQRRASSAATRISVHTRYFRERLFQARLALLGPR